VEVRGWRRTSVYRNIKAQGKANAQQVRDPMSDNAPQELHKVELRYNNNRHL